MPHDSSFDFIRSKIYERLDYQPEPTNYKSKVPWIVQQQIAATNGIHYVDKIGTLADFPTYELPVKSVGNQNLMLDIGCGWGRWLVAGYKKGYIPVGIDLRLEFCQTAREVMRSAGVRGYTIVADLENLPFQRNVFNLVWSFSVMQHVHHKRLNNCLRAINEVLRVDGYTLLEFPNKNGIRNKFGPLKSSELEKNEYDSWCVRYYAPDEYKQIIETYLQDFKYDTHSFLGIGVLKEDLKYVSLKNKILCSASLVGTAITKLLPVLNRFSDSLYISAHKKQSSSPITDTTLKAFWNSHQQNPTDNLNIIPLLKCPKTGTALIASNDNRKLIAKEAGLYYPIENTVPILVSSEAKTL